MLGATCLLLALVTTVSCVTQQPPNTVSEDWVWNNLHEFENYEGPFPKNIGRIYSKLHKPGNTTYILEGDGAGILFKVNPNNGSIAVYRTLDREEKTKYFLQAFVRSSISKDILGLATNFTISVSDINDNAPKFTQEVFKGSIPEMSPNGTSVLKVTAHDADDPTVGSHTKITYQLLGKEQNFIIETFSGIIRVKSPNMDREQKKDYEVFVQAKDMGTQNGGFSSTATVLISLTDINDNPPHFSHTQYKFNVSEDKIVGQEIGRVKAEDGDEGENARIIYTFIPNSNFFTIKTDANTQEGVITLKKPLDFEKLNRYKIEVEADNPTPGSWMTKTKAELLVTVLDVDEPPVFSHPFYSFSVSENQPADTQVGQVKAKDPDQARNAIQYRLKTGGSFFRIAPDSGNIYTRVSLDRETHAWHNITVTATEVSKGRVSLMIHSQALVAIKVLDVNDNAPRLKEDYRPFICERQGPGSLVQVVAAVDDDEMTTAVRFHFSLGTRDSNFTLSNNGDNTANVTVRLGGFNHKEQPRYRLPIVVSDNGRPSMSSTGSLDITVCPCDQAGEAGDCRTLRQPLTSKVNLTVLLISFLFIIILIAIVVLILYQKLQKKPVFAVMKPSEIQEQLVRYDEEGGGEMDTNSFDISVLNSLRARGPRGARGPIPETLPEVVPEPVPVYARVRKPQADMGCVVTMKKQEADSDQDLLPYDTLHMFGEEGTNSVADSLSSLGASSADSEQDYDFLSDWGPRFRMLAELYGAETPWGGSLEG
ncbi:cadherin-5 [Callorhinchus milii]|nr:cadherin-5 [Callorhinchus milii]|eukprot:gi/632978680/ref/XP_007906050.1/ PREDICTED: cadherin-5 [Callorhinchus milii]